MRDGKGAPPPLPARPLMKADLKVYGFPKCPVCRMRNRRGEPQRVFWDPGARCYLCAGGHRFTGKEH